MSCENCQEINKCNKSAEFPKITSAFFILTNQCPLKCLYCFVNQNVEKMSYQTALDATNFLIENSKETGYTPNITFEELKTLLHGQTNILLQSFAEQIMEKEFNGIGNKDVDGYVILFNYDYLEDSRLGKNTIIQFERKKGFNNDEINIWRPTGVYEK